MQRSQLGESVLPPLSVPVQRHLKGQVLLGASVMNNTRMSDCRGANCDGTDRSDHVLPIAHIVCLLIPGRRMPPQYPLRIVGIDVAIPNGSAKITEHFAGICRHIRANQFRQPGIQYQLNAAALERL